MATNMCVEVLVAASSAEILVPNYVVTHFNHGEKSEKLNGLNYSTELFRLPKKKKLTKTYMVESLSHDVNDISLSVVDLVVKMIGSNSKEWWVDKQRSNNVCMLKQRSLNIFESIQNGQALFTGNLATLAIEGKGNIAPKITSAKELTL